MSCVSSFKSVPLIRWRLSDSSMTSPGSSSISSCGSSLSLPASKKASIIARWSCEYKSLDSWYVCLSHAMLSQASGINTTHRSRPNIGPRGRGVGSAGANDPCRHPAVNRLVGQVSKHRSGFLPTHEATTLRRDKGGWFEITADDLSSEMQDWVILRYLNVMKHNLKF